MECRFDSFMTVMGKIQKSIRKLKADTMSSLNLKSSHAYCLYYLYKNKHVTLKKLSELSREDKATVSRTVEFLKSEGYVTVPDAGHYKTPIALTEKGIAAGKVIAQRIDSVLMRLSADVSDSERAMMYDALYKISLALEELAAENASD